MTERCIKWGEVDQHHRNYRDLHTDEDLTETERAEIACVHGVEGVVRERYTLKLYKGQLFDWGPIKTAVEEILRRQR